MMRRGFFTVLLAPFLSRFRVTKIKPRLLEPTPMYWLVPLPWAASQSQKLLALQLHKAGFLNQQDIYTLLGVEVEK